LIIIAAQASIRVDVLAGRIEQRVGISLEQARHEPLAHQPALAIATVGVEAVATTGRPSRTTLVTTATRLDVIFEKSIRRCGSRGDRLCHFAHIDDADGHLRSPSRFRRPIAPASADSRKGAICASVTVI